VYLQKCQIRPTLEGSSGLPPELQFQ
jgi:hypothetical protein